MAQLIKPASIWGRIGTGVGKGMAEQIPKEIEHQRLRSGLKDLAQKSNQGNLSPEEYLAEASGVYGITPQMIQSFGDLAKNRRVRGSFGGQSDNRSMQPGQGQGQGRPGENYEVPQRQNLKNVNFANMSPRDKRLIEKGEIPSDFPTRGEEAKSGIAIANENPSQEKFVPALPWTAAQRDEATSRDWDRHPELSFQEIQNRVADEERRYLEAPKAYQEQLDYRKGIEKQTEDIFDKNLSTALQKEGGDLYKDLTGTTLLNLKKAMLNDLATDSSLTPQKAAEKWQKIGKDFVRTKNTVKELANRDLWDKMSSGKKEEALKSLKSAQKIYDQMGAKDEFYNMLRSSNTADSFGFGLSPSYAAVLAYPRSEGLKKVIENNPVKVPAGQLDYFKYTTPQAKKVAQEFAKNRTSSDSILAFVRDMKDRNPYFDEVSFFDYLRENQDDLKFTPDQQNELIKGVSDMFKNWGDIALFPMFGRSVAHD